MAEIEFCNKTNYKVNQAQFRSLMKLVLEEESKKLESSLSLTFVESDEIRELNKRFRGCDEITDVLSFDSNIDFVPFLGDIIIDISTANRQKGLKSLQEEVEVLFLHGVLHLLGYDHLADHQRLIMETKEQKYIELLRSITL